MTIRRSHPHRLWVFPVALAAVLVAGCGAQATTPTQTATRTITTAAAAPTPTVTRTVTRKAAPTPQPSPTTTAPPAATPAPSEAGGSRVVPTDLIGERLDVAENELNGDNVAYKVIGGGLFGIVVKSNWIVCQTTPQGAGVDLIVDHFSCS